MRQLHRAQRGSANWPFILSLLLLLVFVYLWYSQRDDLEAAQNERDAAVAERDVFQQVAQEIAGYARDLSSAVGWNSKLAGDVITNQEVKAKANTLPGVQDYYFTDLEKLKANLEPDGTYDDGSPGLLNTLINQAQVTIQAEMRRAAGEGVESSDVQFDWLTDEMRDKIAEINAMEIPKAPQPVADWDDEARVAEYQNELAAYEEARAKWEQAVSELSAMDGFEELKAVVAGPGQLEADESKAVLLEMFSQPPTGTVTVADLVTFPPRIIKAYNSEFSANKTEDQAVIGNLQADIAAKDAELADLRQQLEDEQNRHAADVAQLQGEVQQANETAEQNRRDATTALNDLSREKEDKETAVSQREASIRALEERIRIDKEKRDLEIRRDDPDGRILTSSPMMQTAVIDLGTNAKAYPGLKFRVSRIGRGGIRQTVGEVTVIRVLGPNSAKVAVTGLADPRNPIVQGDIISNPFYKATAPIYIYLVGELEKYPLEVALARLERMNVVVDDKPSGRTDYIVVPNDMAAPAEEPSGDEDEDMDEDEGPAGAKSEFERVESLARSLGAQVITERMLNEFLGL